MTTALTGAVELLERSLAWTRSGLALVTPGRLRDPTPCAEWDLAALLHHMDDALDAFTEAATGSVSLVPIAEAPRLESIRDKACALLGWWCEHPPDDVRVGDLHLPAGLLVGAAALEITVHGWDVGQATGALRDVPDDLAQELLPVAQAVVLPEDRPDRFAAPRRTGQTAGSADVLLGFLGRS